MVQTLDKYGVLGADMKLKELFENMDRRSFLRAAGAAAALAMVPSKAPASSKFVFYAETEHAEWHLDVKNIILLDGIYYFWNKIVDKNPASKPAWVPNAQLIQLAYSPKNNKIAELTTFDFAGELLRLSRKFRSLNAVELKIPALLKTYYEG